MNLSQIGLAWDGDVLATAVRLSKPSKHTGFEIVVYIYLEDDTTRILSNRLGSSGITAQANDDELLASSFLSGASTGRCC